MTKKEMIARYGQQYYDDMVARSKAKLNAKYAAMTPEERTEKYLASKDRVAEWIANNPERAAENYRRNSLKGYQKKSPEERKAMQVKRYAARKAKLAADPVFQAAQAEKQAVRAKRWDEAHPGLRASRTNEWEKANPHVKRANKHSRRALGKMDPEYVLFLRSQPCLDCGTTEKKVTIGHLIPVIRGGTNHPCNLVAQCRSCNSKQHSRIHPWAMVAHYPEAARAAA